MEAEQGFCNLTHLAGEAKTKFHTRAMVLPHFLVSMKYSSDKTNAKKMGLKACGSEE